MIYRFCYCTVDELAEDQNDIGVGNDILRRFILPATQYLLGEIGQFQPVVQTLHLNGDGTRTLFVPPLLQVIGSIMNDEITLVAADFILRSTNDNDAPAWAYGPYLRIESDPDSVNLSVWTIEKNDIEIPAAWGLYERADDTGATVATQQSSSVKTLEVGDGSKLSPGMLLQIDAEWQFVTDFGAPTASVTTLAAALDASSEIVSLTSGAAVKVGEIIKIDFEQMKVLDIQTNNAFVVRGWNRTKKVSHLISAAVAVYRTFVVERAVNGSAAVVHTAGTAISRLMVPEDINYLCRQIATLMLKKSQTGYAGRSGSAESGETFYNFEFPRDAIARIKANYALPAVV